MTFDKWSLKSFLTIDEIAKQSVEELAAVDEIGPVIAESVYTFFHSDFGNIGKK